MKPWRAVAEAWLWMPYAVAVGVYVVFAYYVPQVRPILYWVGGCLATIWIYIAVARFLTRKMVEEELGTSPPKRHVE